jgi:hypothetical protein
MGSVHHWRAWQSLDEGTLPGIGVVNLMADLILTFISSGIATSIVAFAAIRFLKRYLSSYVDEKGKNLATKEDIGAITREVEAVKHVYNSLLEELKARNQLRMAALDKRLQAHQEAFTLWRTMFTSSGAEMEIAAQECRDWWNSNCVYLDGKVRDAFLEAVNQEYMRRSSPKSLDQLNEHLGKMFAFPNLLFASVQLPSLSEAVQNELKPT